MQAFTLVVLAATVTVALAGGQYYTPRSYYIIDAEGHASLPVPLRRLRRSIYYPPPPPDYGGSASASANAHAETSGGGSSSASASADARANGGWGSGNENGGWNSGNNNGGWGSGRWNLPIGASAPLNPGQYRRMSGPVLGSSISTGSSLSLDSSGQGYYDTYAASQNQPTQ